MRAAPESSCRLAIRTVRSTMGRFYHARMSATPPPLSKRAVVDRYFLEHRAKVLDIAAFLDRVDRAQGDGADDYRVTALRECCAVLLDGKPDRARRVLELLSDHSTEPIAKAPMKGATGAMELQKKGAI
jgi:hypothetical protein